MTLCALSLHAYVALQRTIFQLSFAAKERHFPWLIAVLWTLATFCMASWLSRRLLARRNWYPDARFLLLRGNCCTTYLSWATTLPNEQIWHGTQSTPRACQRSVSTFLGSARDLLKWVRPEQLGPNSIACVLALGVSICWCTNGVSLLQRNASVALVNKLQITLFWHVPHIRHLEK